MESKNAVKIIGLNSANVKFDNSGDADRVFSISANVEVVNNRANSFNGEVNSNGIVAAVFNCYNAQENANNLSISYQSIASEQQVSVLDAVQKFIASVRVFVSEDFASSIQI